MHSDWYVSVMIFQHIDPWHDTPVRLIAANTQLDNHSKSFRNISELNWEVLKEIQEQRVLEAKVNGKRGLLLGDLFH